MPQCARCGQEIPATADFCPACGQPASQPPSGSAASTRPAAPALPLGDYLKRGWDLFKRYPGGFVGFFLLYILIQLVFHFIPLVGSVAAFAVGPALIMGNFIVCAKLLQDHTPKFSDFFLGFRFFIPLLLTALMGGALTGIGLLLLIIPGLYLMVSYLFAASLVIDRRLDFWPALELSRRTVQPNLFGLFAFLLLLILLNLVGAALLGLGLLVSLPLTGCAVTVAYADIFGLQSDYSAEFPDNVVANPGRGND
jgi:uncharacterized membrane protein